MKHTQFFIFTPILFLVFIGIMSSSPDVFASQSQVAIVQGTNAPGCEANDSCHSPSRVQVGAGDEVLWSNKDSAAHTITSGNPADGPDGAFDSGLIMAGDSFSHTFSQQGTFDYFCKLHPWASGQVVVGPGGTQPPEPPRPQPPTTAEVTIVQGSSTTGCEATNSCHSPYRVDIGAEGDVNWSNKDSAAHTITSGNPADGPDGAFDSGLIMAGDSFSHTFSQQGTFDYFCKLHPWASGQVVVGPGGTIPPRPSGDITISSDLSLYTAGELVKIQVKLADGRAGANIALSVTDADGNDIVTRSVTTDSSGMAGLEFKLAIDAVSGMYKASASALIGSKEMLASTQFDVAHLVSKVSIVSVEPTDQQGNSVSSFTNGKLGFVKVVLDVESKGTALVAVNLFDLEQTSLGVGSIKTPMGVGKSEMVISFFIPGDAALGSADIYANVFSDWPSQGGTPLSEESSTSVNIN